MKDRNDMDNEELKYRRELRQQRMNKLLGFDDEERKDEEEQIPPEKFEEYEVGCFFEELTWEEFDKRFGDTPTNKEKDKK